MIFQFQNVVEGSSHKTFCAMERKSIRAVKFKLEQKLLRFYSNLCSSIAMIPQKSFFHEEKMKRAWDSRFTVKAFCCDDGERRIWSEPRKMRKTTFGGGMKFNPKIYLSCDKNYNAGVILIFPNLERGEPDLQQSPDIYIRSLLRLGISGKFLRLHFHLFRLSYNARPMSWSDEREMGEEGKSDWEMPRRLMVGFFISFRYASCTSSTHILADSRNIPLLSCHIWGNLSI